jgi:hypothetical protein
MTQRRVTSLVMAGAIVAAAGAQAQHARYRVTRIDPVPGNASFPAPVKLNDRGDATGYILTSDGGQYNYGSWIWRPGQGTTLLPRPRADLPHSLPVDITNDGVLVGNASPEFISEWAAIAWRWENGQYTIYPEFVPGRGTQIHAVNESRVGAGDGNDGSFIGRKAFRFLPNNTIEMLFPSVAGNFWAVDINNAGIILGAGPVGVFKLAPDGSSTVLQGPPTLPNVALSRMNDLGDVVGSARGEGHTETTTAWVQLADGTNFLLPPSGRRNTAVDINNARVVIGNSQDNTGAIGDHGWVWTQAGGLVPLQDLIAPEDEGTQVYLVRDINERGQIAAVGAVRATGESFGMILTPVSSCVADFDGDGAASIADFLGYLQAYSGGTDAADFDGSGAVNVQDFLAFLSAYAAGC